MRRGVTDLFTHLQTALADRYTLERELGRGGMATVYLARDLRHRRPVALKVLHPELAFALGADRFLREIEVAANLTHPHILPLFDSGEIDTLLYYVMPYIEGESLRDRLQRETQLAVDDALQIAREVADALAYAHGQGVIHRDIKPENILLYGGHALVLDFGIARALWQADGGRLTDTGLAVGTAAYMSPEQASGASQLDGRSDIYSLGCVLYEMLAGEPPYTGPTAQAIIAKRFSDPVPAIRRLRPTVPDSLNQVVTTALAPMASDRFATAADFLLALVAPGANAAATGPAIRPAATAVRPTRRALTLGLAAALGLVAAGVVLWQGSRGGVDLSGPTRLAVLPFENLGDSTDAYFADGMTDAVRGKLSALPALQVIARQSSTEYKQSRKSLKQIGRELGVQYVLTATVRWEKSGGASRVQVSPELVQVATASTRWQQPFDAGMANVFQVQGQIAGQVATALEVELGTKEQQTLAERPTRNLAAYDAYLKGQEGLEGINMAAIRRATAHYAQSVALDSGFVQAWAGLSTAHSLLYYNSTPTPAEGEQARRAAERALVLDPQSAEGHLAMGSYYFFVAKDNARAVEEYSIARRLAPNDAELLATASDPERSLGHWEAALDLQQRAQALNPRSDGTIRRLGYTLLWLRRFDEALQAFERGLVLAPTNLSGHQAKAMVYLAQGDLAGAQTVIRAALNEVEPTALVADMANYWDLYWVLDDAQQQLLLRLAPTAFDDDRAIWGTALAGTWWLRGDRTKARAYADSARIAIEQQLKATPEDDQRHVFLGLSLAYLGRHAEAVSEGKRGVALLPVTKDAFAGPYLQHQLARIYILVGEPEKALDQLELLLRMPYYLSPGWLRIDPTFAPLRGNPRFERLVKEKI
jgi:eukaryotic-like serine/threonine-protein kinase